MPKKESSIKAREWERDRRERLNDTFNLLGTLLPSYDPSVTRSKIEILQKAVAYISDLQKENRELVKNGKDQSWKQIRHLKLRIESLLRRIQQLAHLLRDAGISIPPELPKDGHPTMSGKTPKWSNKLRQEDAPMLLEKVKNKKENKKKEKKNLNLSRSKVNGKAEEALISVSSASDAKVTSTTSKTKLSQVNKNKKKISKEGAKKGAIVNKSRSELPTVTQLLGLTLNDIDVTPSTAVLPSGSADLSAKNLSVMSSNTQGTNVTVLASNLPQVPQGFIVIPKASSMPTTSKSHLPQPSCIVVAPATQAVSCNQNIQQPCVVMPSKNSKVLKASVPIQQSVPIVLSSTTSALESIAIQTAQKSDVAVTNSHLLTAPIMATGIQSCPVPQGTSLSGLGPGTLILANGSIVPIFPSTQPVPSTPRVLKTRNNTQIVVGTNSNVPTSVLPSQSLLLVQNKTHSTSNAINTSNVKSRRMYSLCLPKPLKRKALDSTRSTFANKVPISALKSRNPLVVHSQFVSAPVAASNRGNKSDVAKSSRRTSDKKSTGIQKGRGSKSTSKMNNKRILIGKSEVKNDLLSCENGTKDIEPEISKITSDLSTKENVHEVPLLNRNVANEVQVNSIEVKDTSNVSCSVEQKSDLEESSAVVNSENKKKREREEDDDTVFNKKVKNGKESRENATLRENLPTVFQTPSDGTEIEGSFTCSSVNEQSKKRDEDRGKENEGMDSYSVGSIRKSDEKNSYSVEVDTDNAECSLKTRENKMTAVQSGDKNRDSSMMTNSEANIKDKLHSDLSCSISLPTSEISISGVKRDAVMNEQIIHSKNTSLSTDVSGNCVKSHVISQTENIENKRDLYNTTLKKVDETILRESFNELKSTVSVDSRTSDVTPFAVATETDQNSIESSSICSVYQQEICSEKKFSVTSFVQPSSDINPVSQKPQKNSVSGDTSKLQTSFVSENVNKNIHEEVAEQTINTCSEVSEETMGDHKDSPSDNNDLNEKSTNTSQLVEEDSCKKALKDDNYIESLRIGSVGDKTGKHNVTEKNNASSEVSSAEYNTFSSVSESNSSVCTTRNKQYRNTESLDIGTSTSSSLCLTLHNNDLSNDLFASLHVPSGGQPAESISPTAAFLLAFPLVSTSKVSDIIGDSQDDVGSDSLQGTSTLLQIGTLDPDHSGAIISRSPTYHDSVTTSKILPPSSVCQKHSSTSSEPNRQELDCQHFLAPGSSDKIDQNMQKIKVEHVKLHETHNDLCESDKTRNKNWTSLQDSSQPGTTDKVDCETNIPSSLNAQSYTTECLENPLQNRGMTSECSKEKTVEQNCSFNLSKEIPNMECSPQNVNVPSSQPVNSNLPSFTVSQFVSPLYIHTPKEQSSVNPKQDHMHTSSALHLNETESINFSDQTSRKNENNFMPTFKNSVLNTSTTGTSASENSSFALRKDVTEQGTMTDNIRSQHVSLQSSSAIKQPISLPFPTNDCSDYSVTSQNVYMHSNASESEKCNIPSFSVAHNSSNFNILSWTTLSPTSTIPNASQYDGFCSQNAIGISSSQNNCISVSKKQNKVVSSVETRTVMTSSSSVPETCPPHVKHSEQVNSLRSHPINKVSEPFSSSTLQNTDNQSSENQALIQQYLTNERKIQNSVVPPNINTVSQISQMNSGAKEPDNEHQRRPPVNWMTAPDTRVGQQSAVISTNSIGNRTHPSSSSSTSAVPNVAVTSKEIQFCSTSGNQNLLGNCTSNTHSSFDARTCTSNVLYGSHSVSSHDSQTSYYQNLSQPMQRYSVCTNYDNNNKLPVTSSANRITDIHTGQSQINDIYTVPWLHKKSNTSSECSSELTKSNFISSSLPTLIGDLALGTHYPLLVNDNENGNKGHQSINFHLSNSGKKDPVCNSVNNTVEEVQGKQIQIPAKNNDQSKNQNNLGNSVHEFRNTSSQSSTSSFLSVSQLVNQAHSSRVQPVSRPSNNHHAGLPNKQDIYQTRSHQMSTLSSTPRESKELLRSLNAPDKMNHKPHQEDHSCVDFRSSESSISLTHSVMEGSNKLQLNQIAGSNSNYTQELSSTVTSLAHSSSTFPVSSSSHSSVSTPLSNNVPWPSDIPKQHAVKVGTSGCKASASSYSAEALIGLNSSQIVDRGSEAAQDPRGNKAITLPPPVVSERFCRNQSFPPMPAPPPPPPPPPPPTSRPHQVPPTFSTDTIIPSTYLEPVELQTHHQNTSSAVQQTANSSQNNLTAHSQPNQHDFNTFTSSTTPSSVRVSTAQGNGVLYTHSEFMSGVGTSHSAHSVSLSCNFLPDLGTNNSYPAGILSDSTNPFLFPSSTIPITRGTSACTSSSSVKQNLTHLHGSNHASVGISGGQEDSNQVLPSLSLGDRDTYSSNSFRCNNGNSVSHRAVSSETNLLPQNVVGGSVCNSSKQRSKKRTSESVTPSGVSGIGGLMDLGYLGMPPVISSPMLTEDGPFINHSGGFLTSVSQHAAPSLYSGVPTPSQGPFYSTPHSHTQTCTSLTRSHSGHLTVNSGSFPSQNTRGLQLNTMVSPCTVSSSGTSLTNFNLSTIFPEINEKQVPNHAFGGSGPKDAGPFLSSPLPVPSLPTSAAPPQLNNSSSGHVRPSTTLLLPPVSSYVHRQTADESSLCLPPPPPPVPLHSNFKNVLNSTTAQMCQWR